MLGERGSKLLVLGWFAFLGAFTFLAYTDFALFTNARWCSNANEHCLRDWIGALSGWAAAVAAALTIFALYDQLREQRKQTSFMLGDALPTISASHPQDRFEDVALRVVNWHRCAADILRVRIVESPPPIRIALTEIRLPRGLIGVDMGPEIQSIIRLGGWEHRADAPPVAEIYVTAVPTDQNSPEVISVTFAVDLLIFETEPRLVTVKARMNLRWPNF